MKTFKDVNIYIQGVGIKKTSLTFGDKTSGFFDGGEVISLPEGSTVLPGFIDSHIHGAGGADTMDGTQSALDKISSTVAREGVTRFLPTTMTQSVPNMLAAVSAAGKYISAGRFSGAAAIGIHLEGPFISPEFVGAQPAEYVINPNISLFEQLNEASGGNISIVTLAPERDGAAELIKHLSSRHICPSIGHSNATYLCAVEAAGLGALSVTHTFNAQSPFRHREAGVVGAALMCDGLYTELIADGIHVSYPAIKLLFKNKPRDKVILITDAIRAKGLGDGVSELGGQKVFVKNGEARLQNGALAGSVLRLDMAIKNLAVNVGIPLEAISDALSQNPATRLGLKGIGGIAVGNAADYAVLSAGGEIVYTVRDGDIIYKNI